MSAAKFSACASKISSRSQAIVSGTPYALKNKECVRTSLLFPEEVSGVRGFSRNDSNVVSSCGSAALPQHATVEKMGRVDEEPPGAPRSMYIVMKTIH